jgi:CHASE1-domain containing sensor protein
VRTDIGGAGRSGVRMKQARRIVRAARSVRLLAEQPARVTLVLGLLVTATLFIAVRSQEQQYMQALFERRADTRIAAIRDALNDAVDVVETVNRAFTAMQPIGRAEFTAFTRPMLDKHPQLHLIAYQRIVADDERVAFEAERRRLLPGFEIRAFSRGHPTTNRDTSRPCVPGIQYQAQPLPALDGPPQGVKRKFATGFR